MISGSIENANIQLGQLEFSSDPMDISLSTQTLKLENLSLHASSAADNAGQLADNMEHFDHFLSEARASRSALSELDAPTLPENTMLCDTPSWSVDRDTNTIDLDNGYRIKLNEGSSEMLLEKVNESGDIEKATKIWGDPHLDAGNDGINDADFWTDSTLALQDGTKITIGTKTQEGTNATFSDSLTITNGDKAIKVTGLMNGGEALQIGDVSDNGKELDAKTNDGHVLIEGNGNDWSLQDGKTIGQDSDMLEFGQLPEDNEVRLGQAWIPNADAVRARGGDASDMPDTLSAHGEADKSATTGAMSDAMRSFLESLGIDFEQDGATPSTDDWDKLIS